MILEIKKWCEGLIVAIFLCIIIESLIPNGSNKKYIKVVVGIYIMYVSLNPILNLLNYDFDFNIFEKYGKYEEVSNLSDNNIKDVYILGIEQDIKSKLDEIGYEVEYVNVFVDLNYENIQKVELKIKNITKKNENQIVEKIIINNSENNDFNNKEYDEILKYVSQNYSVEYENIIIR